ncbi:MAG: ABC transporter ATP-binding protein/permease [Deltaproteobacteria bacterium]|nr:MAG: ABC transporter ATP-binding protein/permease [Deltaproteobacteria bacterium]
MNDTSIPPLHQTWQRMLLTAGQEAKILKKSVFFTIVAAIAQGLAFACFYPLFSALFTSPTDGKKALFWLGALILFTLVDTLGRWLARDFDYSESFATITHELRMNLGEQLRRIPLEILYSKRSGELASVLAGSVDEVVMPMGIMSSAFLNIIITPVVAALATFFVDWRLAICMLLVFPLAIPFYRERRRAKGKGLRELAEINANLQGELVEYVQGLAVLRSVNRTGKRQQRLSRVLEHLREVQRKDVLASVRPQLLSSTFVQGGLLVIVGLGLYFVLGGSLEMASLAALLVVLVRFTEPIAILFGLIAVFDLMEAGFGRIEETLAIEPLPVEQPVQVPDTFDVCFDKVSFAYAGGDDNVFENVSFSVPERSLTALVGPSGAGKTTVTRLLMRYADPQSGSIRIGGKDIRSMEQETLMSYISVVFQDVYLFDDTIAANIRIGRQDASDEEVAAAARAAHCDEFINRLPDGYNTQVGDIGGRLSGGERQRISIARAILKNAPIVILDEPTAALDTESEVAVQQAVDALVKERTVFVIAHRLSTIAAADKILVFDNGHLTEEGTHNELLTAGGRYQAMWQAQEQVKHWHV